jgi:hypothetical protein
VCASASDLLRAGLLINFRRSSAICPKQNPQSNRLSKNWFF